MNQLRQQLLSSREKQRLSLPLENKKNCAEISSLASKGVLSVQCKTLHYYFSAYYKPGWHHLQNVLN